jgi:hypothetical protein
VQKCGYPRSAPTPVCATELGYMAKIKPAFEIRGAAGADRVVMALPGHGR